MSPAAFRLFRSLGFLGLLALPRPVQACKCESSFSVCREVGTSDLIFIGTVEAVEPAFLSRWSAGNRTALRQLNEAYTEAERHPTPAALAQLKDTFAKTVPDPNADDKRRLDTAKTVSEVTALFDSAMIGGMRVRFRVKTLFKREKDDDGPAEKEKPGSDKEKPDKDDSFEIRTPSGDCGIDFQPGETYLVYADNEEGSDVWFTGSCTRTRRLSDAGEDLAYLFYYKEEPKQSGRLEGFTTTDNLNQLDLDRLRDPETVRSPAAGVAIELHAGDANRYTFSDRNGRFVFDGLAEGDYQVSALDGYPSGAQRLAGPMAVHMEERSCERRMLLLPPAR